VRSGSAEIVEDAVGMLLDLDAHTRELAPSEPEHSLA
jgi:macrolide phosphotransferase